MVLAVHVFLLYTFKNTYISDKNWIKFRKDFHYLNQ